MYKAIIPGGIFQPCSLLAHLQPDPYSRLACKVKENGQLPCVILQSCHGKILPEPAGDDIG